MNWLRTWPGGRVAETKQGALRWYIRTRFGGGRREIALDVATENDAFAELALFNRDPAGYKTRSKDAAARVERKSGGFFLDSTTLEEFRKHCLKRVEKGDVTAGHVNGTLRPYLAAWAKALNGRPLNALETTELKAMLKKWKTAEHKRVVALKAFTAWLREEKDFKRKDDPTLELKTPPIIPEKSSRAKGYPLRVVEVVYARVENQRVRDVIMLRAKLGMHDSEIRRIALGKCSLRRVSDPSGIEGTITFEHLKKGAVHSVSCDAQTFAAAERIQASRAIVERRTVKSNVDAAVDDYNSNRPKNVAAIGPVYPGELRHSFATWATTVGEEVWPMNKKGVDLSKVAEAMGHLGKRTTKVFYVGDRVPMLIRLPIKLEHDKDPTVLVQKAKKTKAG